MGQGIFLGSYYTYWSCYMYWPHGMCYSHLGNEVCNGAISITQRGYISDRCKVNPVGQWGKILVMAMGFVDHLGPLWVQIVLDSTWTKAEIFMVVSTFLFAFIGDSLVLCTAQQYVLYINTLGIQRAESTSLDKHVTQCNDTLFACKLLWQIPDRVTY